MPDNTELQRLIRLSRLGRRIAAHLPAGLHGYLRELPARAPSEPTSSEAVLRAQLEAALANYHGPVTLSPPAPPAEPDSDYGAELDIVNDDELDQDTVTGQRYAASERSKNN
jgi:hypothetical protein